MRLITYESGYPNVPELGTTYHIYLEREGKFIQISPGYSFDLKEVLSALGNGKTSIQSKSRPVEHFKIRQLEISYETAELLLNLSKESKETEAKKANLEDKIKTVLSELTEISP